jgi:hypothetical protein
VNGVRLCSTNDEAFDFIMTIADGHLDDVDAIAIASRIRGGQESSGE